MKVYYENELWDMEITLRENLIPLLQETDPTAQYVIRKDDKVKTIRIFEIRTLTQNRNLK